MTRHSDTQKPRPKDHIQAARGSSDQSTKELHEELVAGAPGSDYDRSLTRESDFGGGFGEGRYTGTSWDPGVRRPPEVKANDERDTPRIRSNENGAAGAGKFGGVQHEGLTTGGSSKHSS
jgi:hypothetical protein